MKKVSFHYDFRTEYVVAFLLAVIIILPVELPEHIAELVNNILGKVILIGISVSLFFYHPIVGALALVTIYQLLRRIDNKEGLVSNIPTNDETLGTTFTPILAPLGPPLGPLGHHFAAIWPPGGTWASQVPN